MRYRNADGTPNLTQRWCHALIATSDVRKERRRRSAGRAVLRSVMGLGGSSLTARAERRLAKHSS